MKKTFIFVCLVAVIITFSSSFAGYKQDLGLYQKNSHKSDSWNSLIEPGFLAFDKENFPTAYVFLQKAYDLGCRDGLVLAKLGTVLEQRGNTNEAIKIIALASEHLKKNYPDHEITKSIDETLGTLYFQTDEYDKALPLLQNALKSTPNDFSLLFITGQIQKSKGNLLEAYSNYKKALSVPPPKDIQPSPVTALLKELMVVSYRLNKLDESLSYADQILLIDSKNELALSYKDQIKKKMAKEKEESEIQKMIERYK